MNIVHTNLGADLFSVLTIRNVFPIHYGRQSSCPHTHILLGRLDLGLVLVVAGAVCVLFKPD